MACIFCDIIRLDSPCYPVYRDDDFMAFLDIHPRSKGHTLVIPIKHYRWVYDVKNFDRYWLVVLKITQGLEKSLKPDFITYITHGMEIPHAHIHIIPRTKTQTGYVLPFMNTDGYDFSQTSRLISSKISR